MIIFDYGETLLHEKFFDPLKGTKAILNGYVDNPKNVSAKDVQEIASQISKELRRYRDDLYPNSYLEIHNHQFQNYTYDYFGIKLNISKEESERVFWSAAAPCEQTRNIDKLLSFLQEQKIHIGVISNISFSGSILEERIKKFFPDICIDFVISSADYGFRKPHKRIFEMGLQKAREILGTDVENDEIWYCGDDYTCDIKGSSEAGMIPVWYKYKLENNDAIIDFKCIIINDWLKLIDILKIILSEGN